MKLDYTHFKHLSILIPLCWMHIIFGKHYKYEISFLMFVLWFLDSVLKKKGDG